MKTHKSLIAVAFALVAFGQMLYGQQNASDQKEFAETRVKAEKGEADRKSVV